MNLKRRISLASIVPLLSGFAGLAPAAPAAPATTSPSDAEYEMSSIDEDMRFNPPLRPELPPAQHPPESTPQNVDTNKPFHEWQRLTDDWFGLRPKLDDSGASFQANLTADFTRNLRGGAANSGSAFRDLFNANLTLDTDRLFGLPGGSFFLSFQTFNGETASDDVGDLQGVGNIDSRGLTQISEAWYQQTLFAEKLSVKLGKIDANVDFAAPANGAEFINSSFGVSPTILGLPTYPDPSFAVEVFVNPCDWFYAGLGVFDGAGQDGVETGSRGPASVFHSPSSLFLIAETGVKWNLRETLNGRFAVGVWHHTGDFEQFDGSDPREGATGPYVVIDQLLWKENASDKDDSQGVGAFFQYGYADPEISVIDHHVGGGIAWTGAIPSRDEDVTGVGITLAHLSDEPGAGVDEACEITGEIFYDVRPVKWLSIKPDLQYIHNPGGASEQHDAIAATVRVSIDF